MKSLPSQLIDFSKFLGGSEAERRETAKAILHGFQTAGFIYLKNVSITAATRKTVFGTSAKFFEQTDDTKLSLGWTTPQANRGNTTPNQEKDTQHDDVDEVAKLKEAVPDLKE